MGNGIKTTVGDFLWKKSGLPDDNFSGKNSLNVTIV